MGLDGLQDRIDWRRLPPACTVVGVRQLGAAVRQSVHSTTRCAAQGPGCGQSPVAPEEDSTAHGAREAAEAVPSTTRDDAAVGRDSAVPKSSLEKPCEVGEVAEAQHEYVEFIFKVARSSLDGDNKLGTGGARRPDGTLSGQAYDPRPLPPSMSKPNVQIVRAASPGGIPPWLMAAIQEAAIRLGTIAVEEYALPVAKKLWREKLSPAARRRNAERPPAPSADEPVLGFKEPPAAEVVVSLEVIEPDEAEPGTEIVASTVVKMTRDEAQWHADAARAAFEEFLRHAGALRNARIVDDEAIGGLTSGRHALDAFETRSLDVGKPGATEGDEEQVPEPIPLPIEDRRNEPG